MQQSTDRSSWWRSAAAATSVGLGAIALTLVCLPKLVTQSAASIWGNQGADSLGVIWSLWHTAVWIVRDRSFGVHTDLIGFPDGGDLWPLSPFEAVVISPLTLATSPVFAYSALQLLHQGLLASMTFLLAQRLSGSTAGALFASVATTFSSVVLATQANGNIEVGQFYWVPLTALLALRACDGRQAWPVGLTAALGLIGNPYIGVSALTVLVLFLWGERRQLVVALLAFALVGGPPTVMAARVARGEASLVEKADEQVAEMRAWEGAASLPEFLAPGVHYATVAGGHESRFINGWAPGWTLLVTVGLGLANGYTNRRLTLLSLAGLILALGPKLKMAAATPPDAGGFPLPYALLDYLPGLGALIELWRFQFLMQLGLALMAAHILASWPRARAFGMSALLLAEALVLTPGQMVWRTEDLPPPSKVWRDMPKGAVLTLPVRQGEWTLYYQTLHGQPISATMNQDASPSIVAILNQESWHLPELVDEARRIGFRSLVIDERVGNEQLEPVGMLRETLLKAGLVVAYDAPFSVVDLETDEIWPDPHLETGRLENSDNPMPFRTKSGFKKEAPKSGPKPAPRKAGPAE